MNLFWLLVITATGCSCCWAKDLEKRSPRYEELKHLLPDDLIEEAPTVMVALLVRNKAPSLPLFLTYLEKLDYPKDRMALWIRSDHNSDETIDILNEWLKHVEHLYHSVDKVLDDTEQRHQNESSPYDWPEARFNHLIKLKEYALTSARNIWADYIFYLDADIFLTGPQTLKHLIDLRLPIVAPMLLSEGLYSNFWCGMSPDYYYLRTDLYREIYNVEKEGVFAVPMIHSAVLIHLNYKGSQYLTFDRNSLRKQQEIDIEYTSSLGEQCRLYDGPLDDIIVFAISANCSKIPLFVTNDFPFGYILQPLEPNDSVEMDLKQLQNIKANMVHDLGAVQKANKYFEKFEKSQERQKLGLDHIYMINLERRPERRQKMEKLFDIFNLDVEHFPAVDGKQLTDEKIQEMGIKFLPGYEDPYHRRPMTMGEIGCFLSHYKIWQKMVEEKQNEVLILEDDIRFEPYFVDKAISVMDQIRSVADYDLVYFGRKRLKDEVEPWVNNTEHLVHVGYSYWTLGYVISLKGAEKLLKAKPLENLLPVDEYLPIMFNRHPNETWSSVYPERNLEAFSAAPLLLYPTHYTGDYGYISDTEDSNVIESNASDLIGVELKSDRQRSFMVEPRHEPTQNELPEPELQQIAAGIDVKTREEL